MKSAYASHAPSRERRAGARTPSHASTTIFTPDRAIVRDQSPATRPFTRTTARKIPLDDTTPFAIDAGSEA